jgi:hypothetical protein
VHVQVEKYPRCGRLLAAVARRVHPPLIKVQINEWLDNGVVSTLHRVSDEKGTQLQVPTFSQNMPLTNGAMCAETGKIAESPRARYTDGSMSSEESWRKGLYGERVQISSRLYTRLV